MDVEREEITGVSPTSPAWLRYYERAARRRGGHGDLDHRRLRQRRKRRKALERIGLLASLAGVLVLAYIFDALLSH
jgi:hypothetical protein